MSCCEAIFILLSGERRVYLNTDQRTLTTLANINSDEIPVHAFMCVMPDNVIENLHGSCTKAFAI